jgi:hypothetical protein
LVRAPRPIRALFGALLVGAGLVVVSAPASATDVTVSTETELRAALADPATTTVTLGSSIDLVDCSPTGGDLDRAGALVVDGGGFTIRQTCPGERVLESTSGGLTLTDVTITGGDLVATGDTSGGGVRVAGDVLVNGTTVTGNRVTAQGFRVAGGGIAATGSVTLSGSRVDGNEASGLAALGGGLFADDGNPGVTITDSTVERNRVLCGGDDPGRCMGGGVANTSASGAIVDEDSKLTLLRSSVSGNSSTASSVVETAWTFGGGVFTPFLDATDSHVDHNDSEANGVGGWALGAGAYVGFDATLLRSWVDGNSGRASGSQWSSAEVGGVQARTLVIRSGSVDGNTVTAPVDSARGGGVLADHLVLDDASVTGNRAEGARRVYAGGVLAGDVEVTASTLAGNTVVASGPGGDAFAGGAAVASGTVATSTITANDVVGATAQGGGIAHLEPWGAASDLAITNTTGAGNTATSTEDGSVGGGIARGSRGTTSIAFSTISGNVAGEGANIGVSTALSPSRAPGPVALQASVLSAPLGGGTNCGPGLSITDDGDNHVTDASCTTTPMVDPQLRALADNGGPTSTMLPAATSPLLDQVPTDACLALVTTDQRDVTRPQGSACDIGAVEVEVAPPPTPEPAPLPTAAAGPAAAPVVVADPRFTG